MFARVKDQLSAEIQGFEKLLLDLNSNLKDEILLQKREMDDRMVEISGEIAKFSEQVASSKALLAHKIEGFDSLYQKIELNKGSIDLLDQKIEALPFLDMLEETEEYIHKYLPFKVQNMICDTMYPVVGKTALLRLCAVEQKIFKDLQTNLNSKYSKLNKKEYEIPDFKQRI